MRVIIMGCGRVGAPLAERLDSEGHDVRAIDNDRRAGSRLSKRFGGRFLLGNGFSRRLLEQAEIGSADAFIAVTADDNANIVGARVAKEDYRVPRVVARIYDTRRADIYRNVGIPTVATVRWTVNEVYQLLFHRQLQPEQSFGDGDTKLVRATVAAHLHGRKLNEFNVEGEIQVVELTRGGRSRIPGYGATIQSGDLVSFIVATTSLGRLQSFLGQEVGR